MRFELEKGNVDNLANLLNDHWELSKRLDSGCTNTCIDQIIMSVEHLICGKFIAGAGGGGFIQVILKKGCTKEDLRASLKAVFGNSGVDVWDSEFV
jgi:fucokinase